MAIAQARSLTRASVALVREKLRVINLSCKLRLASQASVALAACLHVRKTRAIIVNIGSGQLLCVASL